MEEGDFYCKMMAERLQTSSILRFLQNGEGQEGVLSVYVVKYSRLKNFVMAR